MSVAALSRAGDERWVWGFWIAIDGLDRLIFATDDEILVELAESEGATPEECDRFRDGLRDTIVHLKGEGIRDFETVAQGISEYRRRFLGSDRVVKLAPSNA